VVKSRAYALAAVRHLISEVSHVPESSVTSARRRSGLRSAAITLLVLVSTAAFASSALAVTFNPNLVISDDNMRADDSYTVADIQAFLASNRSALATRSFPRHDGGRAAPASTIIYEAARAWRISPKVLLVMLQKEQSLITYTGTDPVKLAYKFDWAVGMGVPDGSARNQRYRGFGNQLWFGAQRLDGYGEGKNGSTVPLWKPGLANGYTPTGVKTGNLATYKLYVYNPSIGSKPPYPTYPRGAADTREFEGNTNFWLIHWANFGDPFASPSVRPVYSFQDRKNGSFIYTRSPAEKYSLSRSTKYSYRGNLISISTSGGVNPTPVYKFLTKKTNVYTYTLSERTKKQRLAQPKKYSYRGVAFTASFNPAGHPVYRFSSRKNGGHVFVASEAGKKLYLSKKYRAKYRFEGVAFYVMP
jgi:hypothetical protein